MLSKLFKRDLLLKGSRLANPFNNLRFFSTGDYYDLLGVEKNASDSQIKKAYFKKVKQYHPDQNKSPDAKEKFQRISNAYDTLSKPEKRKVYDLYGESGQDHTGQAGYEANQGFSGFEQHFGTQMNANDIFSQFFGGDFAGQNNVYNSPQRGSNINQTIRVSFMDAVRGCKKEVSFQRKVSCADCKGSGSKADKKRSKCSHCNGKGVISKVSGPMMFQSTCTACGGMGKITKPCWNCAGTGLTAASKTLKVVIPEGVGTGTKVRVSGYGNQGAFGGSAGDLVLEVETELHPVFERDGADIHLDVDVDFIDAILGTKKEVKTLKGDVVLSIKPGTQPGEVVRMSGKGVKVLNRYRYGDQYVHFKVRLPRFDIYKEWLDDNDDKLLNGKMYEAI